MVCNAVMSAGMAELAAKIEGGKSHRDAVAEMYKAEKFGSGAEKKGRCWCFHRPAKKPVEPKTA